MEERWASAPRQTRQASSVARRWDPALLVLIVLAAAIRIWLLDHTEVVARDGVGFIRYAWQLQEQSWPEVLRANPHPPLYPLVVLAVSLPVRCWVHGSTCVMMQLSAQLASAVAGVILVIPTFYVGRALFDRRIGFWAALLFQCLPVSGRVLSDALSEGIFLCLVMLAVWLAVQALRDYSRSGFAVAGLCGGLAYLARPEGALIVASIGLVLLGFQLVPSYRRPWGRAGACLASLIVVALAVGSPYMFIIGGFTNKTTGKKILETASLETVRASDPAASRESAPGRCGAPNRNTPAAAACWAAWCPHIEDFEWARRLKWSLAAVGTETLKGFHYGAWVPTMLGLYWFRRHITRAPGIWILLVIGVLHTLLLVRVAYRAGYLADRHALILVLGGLYWTAAGVLVMARGLAALAGRLVSAATALPAWRPMIANSRAWCAVLLLGLIGSALPKTLEPLHVTRAGFHAAGIWLAQHARPGDVILDPFCWAEFYAGQCFQDGTHAARVPGAAHYVVMGSGSHWKNPAPDLPIARIEAERGTLVFRWPTEPGKGKDRAEEVSIFLIPPDQPLPH
jgi:hypothetical protein